MVIVPEVGKSESRMRDSQHGGQGERDTQGVSGLAQAVLARLRARALQGGGGSDDAPASGLVASLLRAVIAPDPGEFQALRAEMRRHRISETDLVDRYFPAVARKLGCNWAEDRSSFAEVSVGVARMQSVLHDIACDWSSNVAAQPDGATVLLLVPQGEQHSFGAILLASQLRRRGVSVQLDLEARPEAIAARLRSRRYDCALISVGCEEKLELSRQLVKALRHAAGGRFRVVVGGAVLERAVDVQQRTGADLVTGDPGTALAGVTVGHGSQGAGRG